MRMLALTEMISSKFNLYVASRELSKNLINAFELKGVKYIPLREISQDNELMHLVAQIREVDLFIIDGYEELDNFKSQCLDTKKKVLLVQDEKEIQFEAVMILNVLPYKNSKNTRTECVLDLNIQFTRLFSHRSKKSESLSKKRMIFINLGALILKT